MNVIVFGVTHHQAPIEIREQVAFSKTKLNQAYEVLSQASFVQEAIILSTCNRSEIVAVVREVEKAEAWFKDFYEQFFQLEKGSLNNHYVFYQENAAVTYLFRVCCGVDSLVLGEDQILGQVKDAYYQGMEEGGSGKILNRMFLEAISAAKEIKATTGISCNPLSISSIAVKQIERELNDLKGKKVLVIGYGKMSRIAIVNMLEKGVEKVYICNRSQEPLQAIQEQYEQVEVLPFGDRYEVLSQVDIVISATGAPHYVLRQTEFEAQRQGQTPLCIVDIALPRDVEPTIGELPKVRLFHLDELKEIASENMSFRENCLEQIETAIEAAVDEFIDWVRCMPLYSRIQAIQDYSEKITEEELSFLFKKLPDLSNREQKQIQQSVKSLIKKMWRKPILQMKNAGKEGRGETLAVIVDELFDLRHHQKE